MMVTFVSQCEKKSLNRTRRVLDAFANRIGTNTWQTPITKQGLDAVKKLLRKTASKNTAVSCHQLKSRTRTELLWVVGNKDKFNKEGFVPVNYTVQDKFIGETNMSEIYANTKKQPLVQHLFAVGVVAQEIMKSFSSDKKLQKASFIAGCWHDIGKLEVHFQDWLNKELKKKNLITELPENGVHIEKGSFSWEKYPTHNEVSTLIYELLADDSNFDKNNLKAIKHAIFWHHAKPIRKEEINSLNQVFAKLKDNKIDILISQSKAIIASINVLTDDYFGYKYLKTKNVTDLEDEIDDVKLSQYKSYEVASDDINDYQRQIKKNAKENLIRTAVITADRLISSLNAEQLQNHIDDKELEDFAENELLLDRGLNQHIKDCLYGFENKYPNSQRNIQQKQVADKLADTETSIAVLNGPAGCGKTKIALEWALNTSAKQIFWVCPRVGICQSLFKDLTSNDYLPNATIEIHTGEFKFNSQKDELLESEYFSGDIVLTTIDQIINSITTHRNISTLTKFMNATVVFDEFHEYAPMAGFNILFAELIECKKLQQHEDILPNTLLVSATPNYYFVNNFLDVQNIQGIESFNDKSYKIEFIDYDENAEDETNPLYKKVDKNTFVISNTAITAQKSFILNQEKENSLLTHSKFTPKDRKDIFEKVIDSFEQNGSHKFDIVRSGPIIQAALNISSKNMISEIDIAENILQRLGRLNRFAEFEVTSLKIAVTQGIKSSKQTGKSAQFLGRNFQLQSTKVWFEFLSDKLESATDIKIKDLYKWYQEFYQDDSAVEMIGQDFIASIKNGIALIEQNIFEPKRIKLSKESDIQLKKHSLRGNSKFVQMAVCDVKSKLEVSIKDKYLETPITLNKQQIMGRDGVGNLLPFMKARHHSLIGGSSLKRMGDGKILDNARDPEKPIYVSYTPESLEKINYPADENAIYYLKGVNEPIGVMSLSKLQDDE